MSYSSPNDFSNNKSTNIHLYFSEESEKKSDVETILDFFQLLERVMKQIQEKDKAHFIFYEDEGEDFSDFPFILEKNRRNTDLILNKSRSQTEITLETCKIKSSFSQERVNNRIKISTQKYEKIAHLFDEKAKKIEFAIRSQFLAGEIQKINNWFREELKKINVWYAGEQEKIFQEELLREQQIKSKIKHLEKQKELFFGLSELRNSIYLLRMNFENRNNTMPISGYIQIVQKFEGIFTYITNFLNEVESIHYSQDKAIKTVQKYDILHFELVQAMLIRSLRLFVNIWEGYTVFGELNLDKINIEANMVASIFKELKGVDAQININNVPFLSYVEGPNFPVDKNNPRNEGLFQRIEELYKINYEGKDEFLEELIPRIRQKADMNCNFKTLYWDKNSQIDFQSNPENLIGCLYFSDFEGTPGKKARYLGGVNIDPNFQKSGISMFIKKVIQDEFETGVDEIYLVVLSPSEAEQMWKSFGFKYDSFGEKIPKRKGGYFHLPQYKLTRETFNRVFSKAR